MKSAVDVTLPGQLRGSHGQDDVKVSLHWCSLEPHSIVIDVRDSEGGSKEWEVALSLFVAAGQPWAAGSFVGGGDFALAVRGDSRVVLAFKPAYLPRDRWAQVNVSALQVALFLAQIDRLSTPVEAQIVMERQIDYTIASILEASE